MLSSAAHRLYPLFGPITVTLDDGAVIPRGSILAPNHTSLADPGLVLAALHRLGVRPVVLATAGLWRLPLLGQALTREGHIPVHRRTSRAADSLEHAADALTDGRIVLIYGEGGLPDRRDAADREPERFRSGIARLALRTGAPVVPLGQTGARRLASGSPVKQLAGVVTAPLRRPPLHVHIARPVHLRGDLDSATGQARAAVTGAWESAVRLSGGTARPRRSG
ncbi:lysophospholipid acyltransferase family protein [Streptomyces sp. NPDC004609]|uniref:lysophospholipid acyltransferase family protein n=1 Tax=Streptomyces sp. NPDC004609 TaxID=3364704 RepID=UPI003681CAED